MHFGKRVSVFLVAALLLPCFAAAATPKLTVAPTIEDFIEASKKQGLTSIRVDGLEFVYVNPAARLDGYTKVLVESVTVEPDTQWRRRNYISGSTRTLNLRPMIENATARARRAIEQSLARGGYAVVRDAAADAVEITVSINDVFLISVRNKVLSEWVESYSLGTATLVVELRDSISHELILRAFDVDRGPKPALPWNQAGEEAEAWLEATIDGWAEILRMGMDVSNRKRGG